MDRLDLAMAILCILPSSSKKEKALPSDVLMKVLGSVYTLSEAEEKLAEEVFRSLALRLNFVREVSIDDTPHKFVRTGLGKYWLMTHLQFHAFCDRVILQENK